ncbi:unnamed protein product [Phaeothamnion confervicola]
MRFVRGLACSRVNTTLAVSCIARREYKILPFLVVGSACCCPPTDSLLLLSAERFLDSWNWKEPTGRHSFCLVELKRDRRYLDTDISNSDLALLVLCGCSKPRATTLKRTNHRFLSPTGTASAS